MKKIFRVFVSFLLCAASFSCSGFLAEQDTTDYTMSRMSGSRSALESNILGCHRQFAASGFKTGAFCEWLAPASGLAIWGGTSNLSNPQERWTCCHKFTRFSRHPQSYDSFSSFYSAIYRCNSLLESLEDSSVDKAYKREIAGEAYFLRAMAYFYLVRLYGDVTLTLKAPRTVDAAYGPRENDNQRPEPGRLPDEKLRQDGRGGRRKLFRTRLQLFRNRLQVAGLSHHRFPPFASGG